MKTGSAGRESGFTYAGLLFAVVTAALAVSVGARLLGNEQRRDKESQLLFAGDEIRRAIETYHAKNSAGVNPFPRRLEWLLRDPNQPGMQRYLRNIYRDPMIDRDAAGALEAGAWTLILDVNGQIVGVHSASTRAPLKRSGFPKQYDGFSQAKHYSDWKFIAAGGVPVESGSTAATPGRNFIPSALGSSVPVLAPFPQPANAPQAASAGAAPPVAAPGVSVIPRDEPASAEPAPPPPSPPPPVAPPAPAAVAAGAPAPAAGDAPAAPAGQAAGAAPPQSAPPSPPAEPSSGPQPFLMRSPVGF